MRACWRHDPSTRPSFPQIVNSLRNILQANAPDQFTRTLNAGLLYILFGGDLTRICRHRAILHANRARSRLQQLARATTLVNAFTSTDVRVQNACDLCLSV